MILYESTVGGTHHKLGTSGFLYRSNKLMYDEATQSLWNTLLGRPVIGPLVGQGIALKRRSVVSTTWGAWRERHPETLVLDVDTGFERDYGEGVAYAAYFATDELMFEVKERDQRLPNKAEVLGLVAGDLQAEPSLALSIEYLRQHPLYHGSLGSQRFVVLTDRSGAARAYRLPRQTQGPGDASAPDSAAELRFLEWDLEARATDASGARWTLSESALVHPKGRRLERMPAHRAFWFGWFAQHPGTQLVLD